MPTPSGNKDDGENTTRIVPRKLVNPINYDNSNITEEEFKARLAAFDIVRQVH